MYELQYQRNGLDVKNTYRDQTDDALKKSIQGIKEGDSIKVFINPIAPKQMAFEWGAWKKTFMYSGSLSFGLLSMLSIGLACGYYLGLLE